MHPRMYRVMPSSFCFCPPPPSPRGGRNTPLCVPSQALSKARSAQHTASALNVATSHWEAGQGAGGSQLQLPLSSN
eukprot:scaffold7121_cov121-Isochrysis_galbana.AAC.2